MTTEIENDPEITPELLETLRLWTEAKEALDAWKEEESALRTKLFTMGFPGLVANPSAEGTYSIGLPHGWTLKAVAKLNTKIDEAVLPAVIEELQAKKVETDSLFRWKPSLVAAAYKKLNKTCKGILGQAVSQSRGAPTITLIAPGTAEPAGQENA